MKTGDSVNENGQPVSVHECDDCHETFTVCPPGGDDWGGCLSEGCESYDPKRDVHLREMIRVDATPLEAE